MCKSEMTNDEHVFAVTTAAGMSSELITNKLHHWEEDERVQIIAKAVGIDTKQLVESLKKYSRIFR